MQRFKDLCLNKGYH